ncbi:MAG: hypothetical protein AB7F65_10170 [Dehalococcoidia bacterium]
MTSSAHRSISSVRLVAFALALAAGLWLLSTPTPASACTGSPLFDSRIWACGIQIPEGVTEIEWDRGRVVLDGAISTDSLEPRDGSGSGPAALEIWVERSPGAFEGWVRGRSVGLRVLEPGTTYYFAADEALAWSVPRPAPEPAPTPDPPPAASEGGSVFDVAQVVSLYGHPGVPFMGALGKYSAEGAAAEAARVAAEYDRLNGDRDVIPALHLIASVAQASAGDGTYLGRMPLDAVRNYADVTAARGQLLFLDIQVGWGDPLEEVRRYEPLLLQGHVHIALDPEFATRSDGVAPGQAIGSLSAAQINAVQRYLDGLTETHDLPRKVLVVHQFRVDMIEDPQNIASVDGVDLVIDMDGFGPQGQKLAGYDRYANSSYAEYAGFKLFYEWDTPLFTPAEIQALEPPPDYVIYQ